MEEGLGMERHSHRGRKGNDSKSRFEHFHKWFQFAGLLMVLSDLTELPAKILLTLCWAAKKRKIIFVSCPQLVESANEL
jgi:hypothetical protein